MSTALLHNHMSAHVRFRWPVLQHFSISLDDKFLSLGRKKVVFLGTGRLASVLAGVAQCAGSFRGMHNYNYLKIFISFAFHLNNCAAIFTDYETKYDASDNQHNSFSPVVLMKQYLRRTRTPLGTEPADQQSLTSRRCLYCLLAFS